MLKSVVSPLLLALASIRLTSPIYSFVRFETFFDDLLKGESFPTIPIPQVGLTHASGVLSDEGLVTSEKIELQDSAHFSSAQKESETVNICLTSVWFNGIRKTMSRKSARILWSLLIV